MSTNEVRVAWVSRARCLGRGERDLRKSEPVTEPDVWDPKRKEKGAGPFPKMSKYSLRSEGMIRVRRCSQPEGDRGRPIQHDTDSQHLEKLVGQNNNTRPREVRTWTH